MQQSNRVSLKQPTLVVASELQRAYDHFNEHLFQGLLPQCLITLQREKATLGWFSEDRYVAVDGVTYICEIALNPSYFIVRTIKDSLSTLAHEMTHAWQYFHGRHRSRHSYHNTEWSNRMESIGLMPSSTGEPGGARVGERMSHYVIAGGLFDRAADLLLENEQFVLSWIDRYPCEIPIGLHVPDGHRPPERPVGAAVFPLPDSTQPATQERTSPPEAHLFEDLAGGEPPGVTAAPAATIDVRDLPEQRYRAVVDRVVWPRDSTPPQTRVKYTCPGCGINAWARKGADLRCGDCGCRAMVANAASRGYATRPPRKSDTAASSGRRR